MKKIFSLSCFSLNKVKKDGKFPKFYNIKYTTGYQIDKYVKFCCKSYYFINILYEKGIEFIMKFIFPQNYDFKNKLFGFIDYSTVIFNLIWDGFILLILNLFFSSLSVKVFLFIVFCFPLFLLSIAGLNGENFLYVFYYLFRFFTKQKLFFYSKKRY